MTDIASIGVGIQTDSIERGIKALDVLAQQGPKVEKALDGVEKTATKAGKSLRTIGEGAGKGLDEVGRAAPKAADGVGRVAKSADDAKRALAGINASVAGLSQVSAAATQSARGMLGFSSSVQASQKSLIDMQAQVRAASTAVAQMSSAMTSALPAMQAAAKAQMDAAKSAVDMGSAFKTAGDQVRSYSAVSARASDASQKTAKSMDATAAAARGLASALAVAGVGFGAQELIAMVDGYTKYTSQLKLATKSTTDHAVAMSSVKRIATDAQQGLGEVGTLYARIANGTDELGLSQKKLADITEAVALSLKVNGAGASESASAMLQLSQAFGSGRLAGEEFNAVNEAAPGLLRDLATAMGVPVGALRAMASEGKLTSAVLAENLPKALGKLREQAKEVQTISGAFTVLKNNIMEMVGAQSNASGTTKALASGINSLANNLDLVATAGGAVALVFAGRLIGSMNMFQAATIASTAATVRHQIATTAMAASISASSTAMALASRAAAGAVGLLGGPLGAVITVAGLAATAFYAFGSSAGELSKSVGGLSQPLEDLKRKLDALPPEKRISVILDIKEEAAKKAKEAVSSYDDLAASMVGAFSGARAATADSAKQVNELVEKLEDAKKTGADMTPILIEAAKSSKVSNSTLKSWLELAANIREARDASKTGESLGAPGINVGAFPSRGSQSNYDKERAAAAEKLLEITARQSGITKQFTDDLKTYQDALKAGVMTEKEYAAAVTEANKKRYEGTEAGKEAAKQAKAGAGAAKTELSTYASLVASIKAKIAANDAELFAAGKLTESEKLRIQLQAQLDSGAKKLSAAHRTEAKNLLEKLKVQEDEEKAIKRAIALNDERVAADEEIAKAMADMGKQVDAARLSIHDYSLGVQDSIEMTNLEASTLGMNSAARQTLIEQLRIEQDLRQRIKRINDAPYASEEDRQADVDKITAEAMKAKANAQTKAYVSEWEKTSQLIGDTLSDYIMGGGKDAAQYLKRLFATLVLQPIVQYGVNSAMGALGVGQQGSAVQSVLGGNNVGTTVLNNSGLIGAGYQAAFGASVGASSASLIGANAVGAVGGDALGALIATNGGWAGVSTGAAVGSTAVGGAGAAGAGSLMTGVMAAAPYLAAIVALYSIISGMDDSGTPHSGAGAIYSKATGVQDGAGIYNQDTFGMGHRDEYNEEMQAGISGIAKGLGQTLDAFAVSFGKTAGYSVATAFADDSSDDGSWGSLKIMDQLGNKLVDWSDNRASKWAPREFADGKEGYEEYLKAVAVDVKTAFLAMDLPGWADQALKTATDIDTLNAALQEIATVKSVLDGLGKTMGMFADLSGELQTRLLSASGGVEALANNAGAFYESFFTEHDRVQKQRELQMQSFSGMGLDIDPGQGNVAKAAFKKTVEDAMESGRIELAAQLLAMSGSFASTADYAQNMLDAWAELGQAMTALDGVAGDMQARLLAAAGSMDVLASGVEAFSKGFYSDNERALRQREVQMQALGAMGLYIDPAEGDAAKETFRKTVEEAMATGQAELAVKLLAIADSFAATADYATQFFEDMKEAAKVAAEAAAQSMSGAWSNFGTMAGLAAQYTGNTSGLSSQLGIVQGSYANATTTDGRVAALQQIINLEQGLWNGQQAARQAEASAASARASAAREQVNAAKQLLSAAQGLGDYAKSLGFSEASGLGEVERMTALQDQRRELLAKANAGDTNAMQELQGVTGSYLTLAQQMAVSQQDYSVLSGRIAAELAATAAIQEASASSQVSQYERQIAAAESVAASSAGQFTVSAETQKLIDELLVESAAAFETEASLTQKLIDQGALTATVLQGLPGELAGAIGNSLIPAIAGLAAAVSSAMSSAAALNVPQFAAGGLHMGGLRIVGERGPELEATGPSRVWNQSQLARALGGGGNNDALLTELRALREDNRVQAGEIVRLNAKVAKVLERWDGAGMPDKREEAPV